MQLFQTLAGWLVVYIKPVVEYWADCAQGSCTLLESVFNRFGPAVLVCRALLIMLLASCREMTPAVRATSLCFRAITYFRTWRASASPAAALSMSALACWTAHGRLSLLVQLASGLRTGAAAAALTGVFGTDQDGRAVCWWTGVLGTDKLVHCAWLV